MRYTHFHYNISFADVKQKICYIVTFGNKKYTRSDDPMYLKTLPREREGKIAAITDS